MRRAVVAILLGLLAPVVFGGMFAFAIVRISETQTASLKRDVKVNIALCHSSQDRYDTLRALIEVVTAPVAYPSTNDEGLRAAERARNAASATQRVELLKTLDGRPPCPPLEDG